MVHQHDQTAKPLSAHTAGRSCHQCHQAISVAAVAIAVLRKVKSLRDVYTYVRNCALLVHNCAASTNQCNDDGRMLSASWNASRLRERSTSFCAPRTKFSRSRISTRRDKSPKRQCNPYPVTKLSPRGTTSFCHQHPGLLLFPMGQQ